VKRRTAAPIGQIEGAELLVYGVVSEFQMGSSGGGLSIGLPNLPLRVGGGLSNAHMAIDMRVVDTATGRILFANRVQGKATDYNARIGTRFGGGRTTMPISLGGYSNTPMEKAIRVCIDTAVAELGRKTPARYFHYR